MPNELPLIAGTLPAPFTCYQALYAEMFALGAAQGPAVTGILIQDNVPDPGDRDKGWIPTSGGVPRYPGYVFVWHAVLGHWVSRNPQKGVQIYTDLIADLPTYDYGDANPPGPASGPMWEVISAFEGRVPMGVGAIPTSSPAASTTAALQTTDTLGGSGEYKHVLTGAEGAVADHTHPIGVSDLTSDDGFFPLVQPTRPTANWTGHFITGSGSTGPTAETTANLYSLKANDGNGVVSDPHNNAQPWITVYFIRRTAREWIVAA